jgi:phospholipase A1
MGVLVITQLKNVSLQIKTIAMAFTLLIIISTSPGAKETGTITNIKNILIKDIKTLETYKPNYIAIADDSSLKLQISAKKKIKIKDLSFYFAYTQTTFWDVAESSSPLKETNYNPEFFHIFGAPDGEADSGWSFSHWRLGAEHISNGMGGGASRSWNTIYLEPNLNYRWGLGALGSFREGGELTIAPRIWYLIGRKGTEGTHGNIQIDMNYMIAKLSYLDLHAYLQLWYGDGEYLLDYDKKTERVLVGIMFTRW